MFFPWILLGGACCHCDPRTCPEPVTKQPSERRTDLWMMHTTECRSLEIEIDSSKEPKHPFFSTLTLDHEFQDSHSLPNPNPRHLPADRYRCQFIATDHIMANLVPGFVHDGVDSCCPECWKNGCGLNGAFGLCADCLELTNPILQQFGDAIWIFGSPIAFCCIFFFPSDPHTDESSGYEISMLQAPIRRPITCCFATFCVPCAQWHVRRQVLAGDMTKYKLWQGYHDGPQCCARACPGAPITIEAGTYGEQKCPNMFLCLEVCCLAGIYSTCCAFDVSRRYQREERGLSIDPTEQRQRSCIQFFSGIMHKCFQLGCCMCLTSCLVGICAPDSSGAQDCAGEAGRAARSCCRIARTIWKGILWTRCIGMGCLTTQMLHEAATPWDGNPKARPDKRIAPKAEQMTDRGAPVPQEEPKEIADLDMPWDDDERSNTNAQRQNRRS